MSFSQVRDLFSNVRSHAGSKLACHAALGAWIAAFYYSPQSWPLFAARSAPMLAVDAWVPFQPAWALVYQSVFIVHTLALWLPRDLGVVKRYARNVAAVYGFGAVIFWLYPTLSPRPMHSDSFIYRCLISAVDGPRNAFPSLHATLGLLGVAALCAHFRACRVSPWWRIASVLWWVALLYSTLATRQHRLLDLVAGALLGLISLVLQPLTPHLIPRYAPFSASSDQSPVL